MTSRAVRGTTLLTASAALLGALPVAAEDESWMQWGGPRRDFTVEVAELAPSWPEGGPPRLWSRPLGVGHSAVLSEGGRLYTQYREGAPDSGAAAGREEVVIAVDAESGETLWQYRYPSAIQDFSRGPGPHATPLLAGDRLFAIGTNKELHALDKRTGELLWTVDFVADLGAPPLLVRPMVKSGYASSPIAYRDLVIAQVGGPGQSVVAFRQDDGRIAWKSGHFLISGSSPLLIELDGESQLVVFAGSLVAGLDPDDGAVLWAHAHDAGNDFNFSLPLFDPERGILFVSSAYRTGSRALRLERKDDGATRVEELWFDPRIKFQFLNAVRIGATVLGTTGQSGTAFLVAVDLESGEELWRQRGFGQSTLLALDHELPARLLVLSEDGDLALARVDRESVEVVSRARVFDTRSWTVPTLVGSTLYARDRAVLQALDLGPTP